MKNPLWQEAIAHCADPQRARHFHKLFAAALSERAGRLTRGQILVLVALFSGSQALSDWLVAHPDCLPALDLEHIRHPRRREGLQREVDAFLKPAIARQEYALALTRLRQFRMREMLRIAARDLARVADAVAITREISEVADLCLDSAWQVCWAQFTGRFGRPYHPDAAGRWHETPACVLGLGKLGGQELNYSSDVDLLFVYADEGQVFREPPGARPGPQRTMSSHTFFNRLAESFIAEVTRRAPEGMLFRVDLRLRPEGDAGPLCRSLESYENYYAQWGQTWERMMLIKARRVAGDAMLGHEFTEMIQPFRYPRSLNESFLREVAATKDRIEAEVVKSGELDRNIKLGRGGIREIEFVVQALQLLHAGRQPFLQTAQTLPGLEKLAQYGLLEPAAARELAAAYRFLRELEHRLQMEADLQTHTLPDDPAARERLARLMGFPSARRFADELRAHTANVRRAYARLMKPEQPAPTSPFPDRFEGAQARWKEILAAHGFRDPEAACRVLKEFAEGPGYVHVSAHTTALARQLIPRLLALCPGGDAEIRNPKSATGQSDVLSDPDRVLTRLDSFITAYGARAALFELWHSRPAMFELVLRLFDRSEFLAERAIRTPDLLDDLIVGERLRQRKSTAEIRADLEHGTTDADQWLWLRRYHEAEQMRLGLRDILGLVDFEQNLAELSALAEACLQYALQVALREQRFKSPPLAIIGLGKLGGGEINYGSDLDVLFVTEAKTRDLPRLQKVAARVLDLLSRRTEQGIVFVTDARLRPDGEKGLLVNTLAACEEYYRQRAQLWELQSLTRARAVAGDARLGEKFQTLAAKLTDFRPLAASGAKLLKSSPRPSPLAPQPPTAAPRVSCYTPDWKTKIHEMRLRIQRERTPRGQDELAIKTGAGGLMDAEFIAQTLCLEHGWHEPHTLRALERGRDAGVLPEADKLLANYRQLRRLESILRRWSYEGETVLPDEPAPYRRVSVRCGFATPEAFRAALAGWRQAVREVYDRFFGVAPAASRR
jgi:glutamate-ammonia-ligase adenylyltransferase